MEPMKVDDLSLRLLKLQQRFDSYCALHDEDLAEIRQTLQQLRAELHSYSHGLGSEPRCEQADSAPSRSDDKSDEGTAESLPALSV